MDHPAAYPAQWETHAVLKDGSTVELRPIRPDDREALAAFHGRQSRESIYFRYFTYRPELTDSELDHFTQVDYRDRMAFVALLGRQLVAVARYERWKDRPEAELAFFVDDDHHGKGLATLMLEYLAAAARERGLAGFTASVLPENYRMLAVFRRAGFEVTTRFADGVIEVELGIEVTAETSTAMADRQRHSTARSVGRILEPSSIAVIGAARTPGTVGHELIRNLHRSVGSDRVADGEEDGESTGVTVYPVNPEASRIDGLEVHRSIAEVPDPIDLAVVAVRAELVAGVVEECAAAGVQGLLVVSSGFSEIDGVGRERERHLVDLARDNGMRLIGPNAFGLVNTRPGGAFHALFHPVRVERGSVALASQSGPLGAALLERLRGDGLGVSTFVGFGNRADVSVNDLLDYWDLDEATSVVLLYVENFGNLRNFSAVARRASLSKPIITIAPSSPDLVELLEQSGVILVDEVSQLAEQADMAANQPVARGDRVVIVGNAASLARLAAMACRRCGLDVVVPAAAADAATDDSVLIGDLDTVSLLPSGDPADYERVVVAASVSDEVDLVLLAIAPTAYLRADALRELLDRVNRSIDKPVAAIALVDRDELDVPGLPVFTFPEEAAQVLGRHARYGLWRRARQHVDEPPTDPSVADTSVRATDRERIPVIDELLAGRGEARLNLASPDLDRLLDALDIPLAAYGVADDLDELAAVADRVGYPVVMKAGNLPLRSVGEGGGAAIDLHHREGLVEAYERMSERLGVAMRAAVVQKMVQADHIARLELAQDPSFGSMISIGVGGAAAPEPAARRFLPLDDAGVAELVEALATFGRGDRARRLDDAEVGALVDLVQRLAAAADRAPELARLTLNPIMLAGADTVPVDVEIVLARRRTDALAGLRHLSTTGPVPVVDADPPFPR